MDYLIVGFVTFFTCIIVAFFWVIWLAIFRAFKTRFFPKKSLKYYDVTDKVTKKEMDDLYDRRN